MRRPKPAKKRVWLNIDEDILKWVYKKIQEKVYASESHCFESLVMEKMKKGDKDK